MPRRLLEMVSLFQCAHEFSWPRRRESGDYYQVCLLCGAEYHYDWHSMRRTRQVARDGGDAKSSPAASALPRRPHRSWRPRERRIKCDSPLSFRLPGEAWGTGVLENISRTGVLFRTEEKLARGQRLQVVMEMPEEIVGRKDARVLATGRVTRIISGPSAGQGEVQTRRRRSRGTEGDGIVTLRIAMAIEGYKVLSAECA